LTEEERKEVYWAVTGLAKKIGWKKQGVYKKLRSKKLRRSCGRKLDLKCEYAIMKI